MTTEMKTMMMDDAPVAIARGGGGIYCRNNKRKNDKGNDDNQDYQEGGAGVTSIHVCRRVDNVRQGPS